MYLNRSHHAFSNITYFIEEHPMSDQNPNPCLEVAQKLVQLCNEDKNEEALETLYADNIESVEVCGDDECMPRVMNGIEAIKKKNQWWCENHEVHSASCIGPFPHGDRFIVMFKMDITPKVGPMANQRMQMEEAALYTVENDKIVKEEFFYDISGFDQ